MRSIRHSIPTCQRRRRPERPDRSRSAAGKTVVVGHDRRAARRSISCFPGWGKASGVYIHIIGAETLKAGDPVDLGWLPAFLLAAAGVVAGRSRAGGRRSAAMLARRSRCAARCPDPARSAAQIFADITAGLFVIAWVAIGLALAQRQAPRPDQRCQRPAQPQCACAERRMSATGR